MPFPITDYNVDVYFYKLAGSIVRLNFMKNVNPNWITYTNCCISVYLFINFTLNTEINSRFIFLIFIRSFIDILDGTLARYYNKTTKFGRDLDCWCDRIFSVAMLFWSIIVKQNISLNTLIVLSSFISYYTNKYMYLVIHDNTMLFMPITFYLIW